MSYELYKQQSLKYADDQYDIGYKDGYRKAMSVLENEFTYIKTKKLEKPGISDEIDLMNL